MAVYDKKYMRLALDESDKALRKGDYPVGAVLLIDGEVVGKMNNSSLSKKTWGNHAETQLLLKHSQTIREAQLGNKKSKIELYSTLEPCMMCLGCAMIHRVTRIVYACPDPRGGATEVDLRSLPSFYKDNWPQVKAGVMRQEAYDHLITFMSRQESEQWKMNKHLFMKKMFEDMSKDWK